VPLPVAPGGQPRSPAVSMPGRSGYATGAGPLLPSWGYPSSSLGQPYTRPPLLRAIGLVRPCPIRARSSKRPRPITVTRGQIKMVCELRRGCSGQDLRPPSKQPVAGSNPARRASQNRGSVELALALLRARPARPHHPSEQRHKSDRPYSPHEYRLAATARRAPLGSRAGPESTSAIFFDSRASGRIVFLSSPNASLGCEETSCPSFPTALT
jgi:hypothetical protein